MAGNLGSVYSTNQKERRIQWKFIKMGTNNHMLNGTKAVGVTKEHGFNLDLEKKIGREQADT